MVQENIYQQIVFGIRQLVNGEGGSGRIIDMSVDADNNAIVVELAEMTDSFREALMDDIHGLTVCMEGQPVQGDCL